MIKKLVLVVLMLCCIGAAQTLPPTLQWTDHQPTAVTATVLRAPGTTPCPALSSAYAALTTLTYDGTTNTHTWQDASNPTSACYIVTVSATGYQNGGSNSYGWPFPKLDNPVLILIQVSVGTTPAH